MIMIPDYELFVDKRTSKNNNTYYGLYIKVGNIEKMLCFIDKSVYDSLADLSD